MGFSSRPDAVLRRRDQSQCHAWPHSDAIGLVGSQNNMMVSMEISCIRTKPGTSQGPTGRAKLLQFLLGDDH
ncbi:hypothetical protein CHS0354_007255 [Potamilus streckersoni]|uniref:Uncharacterized protein n=1 Tax=Potamilus streckersoni TaxID=2493646 RepID=A0AAE0WB84_9BIVA|nr:hypothetical protein CHS0354_007255 [Potamilus streckersoni]